MLREEFLPQSDGHHMIRVRLMQIALMVGGVAALEVLCRMGVINSFTMISPSQMVVALAKLPVTAPWFWPDVSYTLINIGSAVAISVVGGFLIGLAVHALPRLRSVANPIFTSYYAVPTFILYPLLIVFFGIGPLSLIVMGALFGIVAMIVATIGAIEPHSIGALERRAGFAARADANRTADEAASCRAAFDDGTAACGGLQHHRHHRGRIQSWQPPASGGAWRWPIIVSTTQPCMHCWY